MEIVALLLFLLIFILILFGFPVAFTMAGLSVIVGSIFLGVDFFYLLPSRFMGVMGNQVLIAVPLFIFMGLMLEKSGIAEKLLESMAVLFGKGYFIFSSYLKLFGTPFQGLPELS